MSKRLGELLIERRLLDGPGLERALQNQLLYGGHLGTSILELGYADEESLGRALAELHGVPYAGADAFARVRKSVLGLLYRRLVEECRAIPLVKSGRKLFVAMVNPKDLTALDALSFVSGLTVIAWVTPEFRMLEAMEKFYGIARSARYVGLSAVLAARGSQPESREPGRPRIVPAQADTAAESAGELGSYEFGYGRPWHEIAEEMSGRDVSPEPADRAPRAPSGWERLTERLCAADNREQVAQAVLDELATTVGRAALFAVRKNELALWDSRGIAGPKGDAAPLPIDSPGVLTHLLGDDHYRGPVGTSPEHRRFYEWLGIDAPAEILLVPVYLNDRLVAVIYADGGPRGQIGAPTEHYRRLARMLALALTAIVYKNRIRETGAFASEASA
jgi:Type II secretion system (T2SS), protein E, N-terminal domain